MLVFAARTSNGKKIFVDKGNQLKIVIFFSLARIRQGIEQETTIRAIADVPGVLVACKHAPANRISDDGLDLGIVVDRECFVTGLEVEDLSLATVPAITAAEDLATFEPADEHLFLRRGNVEIFTIHFLVGELDDLGNAMCNGVVRIHAPHVAFLGFFAPREGARCSHETLERLREVARVQGDETHAIEDPVLYLIDDVVLHLVVRAMPPPDQDVGLVKNIAPEAVLFLVESRGLDIHVRLFFQEISNRVVNSLGIDRLDEARLDLVAILVPDGYLDLACHE
jgi:hypothetical protein